jgi:hypothetical protein
LRVLIDEDLPPKLAQALALLVDEFEVVHMRVDSGPARRTSVGSPRAVQRAKS